MTLEEMAVLGAKAGLTSRILPPAEWPRLAGTELETVWPTFDQSLAQVVVVEDRRGAIVACWSLLPMLHVEGLWVAPSHRQKAGALLKVWGAMTAAAQQRGCAAVMTSSTSPLVSSMLARRCAVPLPGEMFVLPLADPPLKSDEKLGQRFHEALFALLPEQAQHPDDPGHDGAVGRAIRIGVLRGDPSRAEREYNVWASLHKYVPIRFVDREADGTVVVDIGEAVITVTTDLQVRVIVSRL